MPNTVIKCKKCHSTKVVKCGHRKIWSYGKQLRKQAYICNGCGSQWTADKGEIVK